MSASLRRGSHEDLGHRQEIELLQGQESLRGVGIAQEGVSSLDVHHPDGMWLFRKDGFHNGLAGGKSHHGGKAKLGGQKLIPLFGKILALDEISRAHRRRRGAVHVSSRRIKVAGNGFQNQQEPGPFCTLWMLCSMAFPHWMQAGLRVRVEAGCFGDLCLRNPGGFGQILSANTPSNVLAALESRRSIYRRNPGRTSPSSTITFSIPSARPGRFRAWAGPRDRPGAQRVLRGSMVTSLAPRSKARRSWDPMIPSSFVWKRLLPQTITRAGG